MRLSAKRPREICTHAVYDSRRKETRAGRFGGHEHQPKRAEGGDAINRERGEELFARGEGRRI